MNKRKMIRRVIVKDMQGELWMPIKQGRYYCSNYGRVKSVRQFVYVYKEFIMDGYITKKGYHSVFILGKGKVIHRLVAKCFIPNPGNKAQVNHKNGIKTDNKVENLEWVTNEENQQHAVEYKLRKGINLGEAHPLSVLSNKEVLFIFKSKLPKDFLCKKYRICASTVDRIRDGSIWSHITKKQWVRQKKMLTNEEAVEIFNSPLPHSELAEKYGVKKSAIFNLKSGHSHSQATGKVYSPKRRAA